MTENGVGPAAQHRRHPAPVPSEARSTYRVHPAHYRVKTASRDAVLYRLRVEAQVEELRPGDDSVLPVGKLPQPGPPAQLMSSVAHGLPKASVTAIRPRAAPPSVATWRESIG
jgi:hypothetical protein